MENNMKTNMYTPLKSATVTYKLTITAMFAALACIATMLIQIPSPTNGYINLGDCIVILSGLMLGPVYGGLAAGIGSMLADVLSGYMYYAPGTFTIKLLMAVAAFFIYKLLSNSSKIPYFISATSAALAAEAIMVFGYFVYAGVFLGGGLGAAAGIPANIVQGVAAMIISVLLYSILKKIKL